MVEKVTLRRIQTGLALLTGLAVVLGTFFLTGRGGQGFAAIVASALAISFAAEPLFDIGDPRDDTEGATRAAITLSAVCFMTLGLSALVGMTDRWPVAVLWAGACLVGGGFLGMLFGVPLQGTSDQASKSQNLLVQTADTFSKFITGATLAKFGTVFKYFQDASLYLAQSLQCCGMTTAGKVEFNSSLAGGLILYFSALGFVAGILLSRFYNLTGTGDKDDNPPAAGAADKGKGSDINAAASDSGKAALSTAGVSPAADQGAATNQSTEFAEPGKNKTGDSATTTTDPSKLAQASAGVSPAANKDAAANQSTEIAEPGKNQTSESATATTDPSKVAQATAGVSPADKDATTNQSKEIAASGKEKATDVTAVTTDPAKSAEVSPGADKDAATNPPAKTAAPGSDASDTTAKQ